MIDACRRIGRRSMLALVLLPLAAAADTVTLTELPAPANPIYGASKIAADGTVVGNDLSGAVYRWRPGQAAENLGGQTATIDNVLPLIAKRGSAIVAAYNYFENGLAPSAWLGGTNWQDLPGLVLFLSRPYGISYDGTRVVGGGGNLDGDTAGALTPWLWNATDGQRALEFPDGSAGGQAWAVSNDGRIAAGLIVPDPADPAASVAARWVDGVVEYLTDADGNRLGQAVACNEDCSVIVGQGGVANRQAWRWTEAGGAEYLGDIAGAPDGSTYVAMDVSADARVIVGSYFAFDPSIGNVDRPFIWTAADHLRDMESWLADNGIDYGAGFKDLVASSITPDGRKIVLNGFDANNAHHAAVVTITPPDSIFGDGFDVTPL